MKIERDALLQVILTTNVDPALKDMKKMQVLIVFLFLVSGLGIILLIILRNLNSFLVWFYSKTYKHRI